VSQTRAGHMRSDEVRNDPGTVLCEDAVQQAPADNSLGVGKVPPDEPAWATKDHGVLGS
jgi:hypothetical protein